MVVYSRILQILGCCNFVICVSFTIYGHIFPSKIEGGMFLNTLGSIFVTFALFLMLVLIGIFYVGIGSSRADDLIVFNVKNIILYVVVGFNLAYRLFFCDISGLENGSSLTGAKIMAGFATAMLLNLSVAIMTTNYLNLKR